MRQMKMKKYRSSITVVFALLFAPLLACGGGSSSTTGVDASSADTSKTPTTSDAKAMLGDGGGSSSTTGEDASSADISKTPGTSDAKTALSDTGGFSASSTQTLSQLTTVEKQALCDQVNANQGGYNRVVQCSSGSQTTDTNQASCVAGIPSVAILCPTLTVGDLVGCSAATGSDLCNYATIPDCSAVFDCLG
jgi:hypothetical protein